MQGLMEKNRQNSRLGVVGQAFEKFGYVRDPEGRFEAVANFA
jgi:hypothetical protein